MNKNLIPAIAIFFFFSGSAINAQTSYRYSVDLTNANNDQLSVELITPTISKKSIVF